MKLFISIQTDEDVVLVDKEVFLNPVFKKIRKKGLSLDDIGYELPDDFSVVFLIEDAVKVNKERYAL